MASSMLFELDPGYQLTRHGSLPPSSVTVISRFPFESARADITRGHGRRAPPRGRRLRSSSEEEPQQGKESR